MAKEDWKQIDGQALAAAIGEVEGAECWALYEASKVAYRAYKAERDRFEAAMQEGFADKLPAGMELKFGYNFGKLSVAVGPVTAKAKAKSEQAGSLSDWLAGQAASGARI